MLHDGDSDKPENFQFRSTPYYISKAMIIPLFSTSRLGGSAVKKRLRRRSGRSQLTAIGSAKEHFGRDVDRQSGSVIANLALRLGFKHHQNHPQTMSRVNGLAHQISAMFLGLAFPLRRMDDRWRPYPLDTVVGPQLLSLHISRSQGAKAAAELELKSMVIRKENNWTCFDCKLIAFIYRYYGSGYPGQQQCGVDGRGFPFVFWPVVFTAPAIGGGDSYLYREAEVLIFRLLRKDNI